MADEFESTPFEIVIDTREQLPYRFQGFQTDARRGHVPLVVRTTRATLRTGDYSLSGMEGRVAIERKSLDDAYSTFIHSHERFKRELARMTAMDFACVVIESTETNLYEFVRHQTGGSVKSVYRCLRFWPVDYGVHFLFSGGRDRAQRDTFRILQRFWLRYSPESRFKQRRDS